MARRAFGDCIGCGEAIPPPYLQFVVQQLEQQPGEDAIIHHWEEVDICNDCAARLTADDLHRLVQMPEEQEAEAEAEAAHG